MLKNRRQQARGANPMADEPSNSLLKELNNNPAQFTRIMEILNKLQDDETE